MWYEPDSDTAMAIDRKRRADDVKAKAFRKLEDEAKKFGCSLVKHCPVCRSNLVLVDPGVTSKWRCVLCGYEENDELLED